MFKEIKNLFGIGKKEIINNSYTKDKNNVYYEGDIIETEVDTVERLDSEYLPDYIKDKNYVYYKGNIIEGADSNTSRALSSKDYLPDYIIR